jgi:Rieske Fe-S protein
MFFAFLRVFFCTVAAAAATATRIQKTASFFNHWTCIGVIKNIDFTRPYKSNIGELPLVTWRGNCGSSGGGGGGGAAAGGKLYTTIDICKHMGSRLSAGEIVDCSHGGKSSLLKCPYHGLEYGANDAIGETVEYQGKLFWRGMAPAPAEGLPPAVPFYNNEEFRTTVLEYTMDASLYDSAYNTMDILHPEFVHNRGGLGFGSSVPPTGLRILHPDKDSIAMMFGYKSNRVVRGAGGGAGAEAGGRSISRIYMVARFI